MKWISIVIIIGISIFCLAQEKPNKKTTVTDKKSDSKSIEKLMSQIDSVSVTINNQTVKLDSMNNIKK